MVSASGQLRVIARGSTTASMPKSMEWSLMRSRIDDVKLVAAAKVPETASLLYVIVMVSDMLLNV
jgi:hypothetical protein